MEQWARCGLGVLLMACWYAPSLRQRGDPAHMHVDCSKANSLKFRVHFSHLFMHAPLPKAPPGCRVPSPSS